ncbi:hypothetical protein FW755_09315 [Lonepinella koalarum]|uniref:hypothetical protein n=1 Tax=Lonepinella koalarum TaxID=53417 RepID=UPI0011E44619|nr:hypothetical protein [Lonepinella koalarum]TYG35275.1 hypothetical protein FW755_09315 [Lonepinella koalarum]
MEKILTFIHQWLSSFLEITLQCFCIFGVGYLLLEHSENSLILIFSISILFSAFTLLFLIYIGTKTGIKVNIEHIAKGKALKVKPEKR